MDEKSFCEAEIENTVFFLQRSGALGNIWNKYLRQDDFFFTSPDERKHIEVEGCVRGKQIVRPFFMWPMNDCLVLQPAAPKE